MGWAMGRVRDLESARGLESDLESDLESGMGLASVPGQVRGLGWAMGPGLAWERGSALVLAPWER